MAGLVFYGGRKFAWNAWAENVEQQTATGRGKAAVAKFPCSLPLKLLLQHIYNKNKPFQKRAQKRNKIIMGRLACVRSQRRKSQRRAVEFLIVFFRVGFIVCDEFALSRRRTLCMAQYM